MICLTKVILSSLMKTQVLILLFIHIRIQREILDVMMMVHFTNDGNDLPDTSTPEGATPSSSPGGEIPSSTLEGAQAQPSPRVRHSRKEYPCKGRLRRMYTNS